MELRQLRYLLKIIECRNFNKAAIEMHITQPALSKSMKILEEEMGVPLLERSTHGVFPTVYGRIVANSAVYILAELRRSSDEIQALVARGTGKVVIGGGIVLRYILPSVRRALLDSGSPIRLEVVERMRTPLLESLIHGDVDIAVCSADDEFLHGRVQIPLLEDQMAVVAHQGHPLLRAGRPATLQELSRHPWVVPSADEVERHQLEFSFLSAGLELPSVLVETSSVSLMANLLGDGTSLSYLPRRALRMDDTLRELRAVDTVLAWEPRRVSLFVRESSQELAHIGIIVQTIREVARQSGEPCTG